MKIKLKDLAPWAVFGVLGCVAGLAVGSLPGALDARVQRLEDARCDDECFDAHPSSAWVVPDEFMAETGAAYATHETAGYYLASADQCFCSTPWGSEYAPIMLEDL